MAPGTDAAENHCPPADGVRMKRLYRGLLVALLQGVIVLSMTAKYQSDRDRLPLVWAKVMPVDPNAPLRGRYLQLRLEAAMESSAAIGSQRVFLSVHNGQLTARPDRAGALTVWQTQNGTTAALQEPIAFFLSDTAKDPSQRNQGEELWAEVTVPPNSLPRPIRLGIKKDGLLTPLSLN
jgi:hypothetical protein